ncbi:MAG: HEPN domain-containing protein [Planctomycetota bacterium]
MNRWKDWWGQAERDLQHARHSLEKGDHEWASFAAQQSGEKAVKALILASGGDPWGHSITRLLEAREGIPDLPEEVGEQARRLDRHYVPARYPNGLPAGHPGEMYTPRDAEGAISDAEGILAFCRRYLPG